MPPSLHILVTCTKRKTCSPLPSLVMRDVPGKNIDSRLDEWMRRTRTATGPTLPAGDLYAGDHWRVASELPQIGATRGYAPTLWVISAGYGLIAADRRVHPYAAAFSPGHPDCVTPTGHRAGAVDGFRLWWKDMAARRPAAARPRTLLELVKSDPGATFLVVASELYLKAVWPDLAAAGAAVRQQRRATMLIVSAGTKAFGDLADFSIPIDARVQAGLGGARRSLNTRMARQLLSWMEPGMGAADLRDRCEQLLRESKPVALPRRAKCSDDDVARFIRSEFSRSGSASANALLRRFRDEAGHACEQKRFSRLVRQVKEATVA